MFCPNCGKPHADWVRFCTECGASMNVPIYPPAPVPPVEMQPEAEEPVQTAETAETAEAVQDTADIPVEDVVAEEPAEEFTEDTAPAFEEAPAEPAFEQAEMPIEQDTSALLHPVPMGEKPVSLGKWLAILALEMLCSVAHIVLLFVWGFSRNTEKSMQNYARAKLIVIGATAVLTVLLMIVIFAFVIPNTDMSALKQYMY